MIRRGSFLSSAWLVTGFSLAAIGVLVFLLWSMGSRTSVRGKNLRIFCAAGMRKPVRAIIEQYEKDYGVTIEADYKGTGELMESLGKIGVPGDLFLSADSTTMQDAVKAGLVKETFKIAQIRPVLVVNRQTHDWLVADKKTVSTLADMLRKDLPPAHFKHGTFKVALANRTAAIGRVGEDILMAHGVWPKLLERRQRSQALFSNVGTVLEVAQRVSQMDGFIGIVWDATAKDYPNLVTLPVPELAEVIEHVELGVLKRASSATTALHFARYATARDRGLPEFAAHQFKIVDGDVWADRPQLRLAAGMMLKPGLEPVLKQFKNREGVDIDTDFDGCGLLVSKMHAIKRSDDPHKFPDVYVSCDVPFAEKVQDYFEEIKEILENDLVIIVPKGNPKDVKPTLEELKRTDLKVGLPHPKHSAMGATIVRALERAEFPVECWDATKNPRVMNNPKADYLVSQIGSLDLAIVARSNALSNPLNEQKRLEILEIAEHLKTRQTVGIAHGSPHKHLAERLLRAIVAPESLARFRNIGFHTHLKKS